MGCSMKIKCCSKCKIDKPTTKFFKNSARTDGLDVYCKDCAYTRRLAYLRTPKGKEASSVSQKRRRIALLQELGGACVCCGETQYDFLQFDHINNDGAQHRKMLNRSCLATSDIRKYGLENFQVLCANCNSTKTRVGGCPHQLVPSNALVLAGGCT